MFLKEKRDRTIKARGCADGRSQHEYTTRAETSSPTVLLEARMMLCAIDTREGRHVAVTDIPGEFLHADIEEDVHMLLEGTIAKLQEVYMGKQAQEADAICKTKESTIWDITGSASVLATTFGHSNRMGF